MALGFRILGLGDFIPEDDVGSALGAHNRDFSGGESENHVCAEVAGAHGNVSSSVGLPGYDGNLGDRCFGVSVEEFCPVTDDPSVLLVNSRQVTRHVDQSHERYVESVAEPHEP